VALGGAVPESCGDGDGAPEKVPSSLGEGSKEPEFTGEPLGGWLALPLLLEETVLGDPVAPPLPLPHVDCEAEPLHATEALPPLDEEAEGAALEGLPTDGEALPVDEE
jgi:hypothetical protein